MGRLCAVVAALLLVVLAVAVAVPAAAKVTVHLVAHTHDDMGWLKTVDQYQYGLNNTIQVAHVNAIISSAIGSLLMNPERKFTYVEIGFFSRWWAEQTEGTRRVVRTLVGEGRLQFANGAWCMHDEASTHFVDMIDQTTLGHRWLQRELGVVPRVGWQVDPFGHSATQAALLTARAGLLATYFGRVDYQDFAYRGETGRRQFWWQASPSMPDQRVFAEIHLRETYCSPEHFRYDAPGYFAHANANEETDDIVDDVTTPGYNVPLVLKHFKEELKRNMNVTRGKHVMWTMGCDFTYFTSDLWFRNLDKLIRLVNADGEYAARYSTPYEYTLAKMQEEAVEYDTKTGDFFPYANAAHQFWTGHYTSRPNLKRLIRQLSSYWTAARQVEFLAGVPTGEVPPLSDALAIAQHHDAVTGTAKQHVTFDYVLRLAAGYKEDAAGRLRKALAVAPFQLHGVEHCLLANVSVCGATGVLASNNASVTVAVWNPSAHAVERAVVQIPVPREDVVAAGHGLRRFTVVPSPAEVSDYSNKNAGRMPYTLVAELSLQGLVQLTLTTPNVDKSVTEPPETLPTLSVEISNEDVMLRFENGELKRMTNLRSNVTVNVEQTWCYFRSNVGDNVSYMSGGAYIMRPLENETCEPITPLPPKLTVLDGMMGIVEQRFGPSLVQRLTLRGDVVDVEYTSFGIPVEDGYGRELMTRFRTSVRNGDVFYTDSNGREMMKRRVDWRADYPFEQTEPLAGNVYPMTTLLFINDTDAQFSIFPDAAMGGTSLESGDVLLSVHRRLLNDDYKGVGEALNETEFVTSYDECIPTNITKCGHHYGEVLRVRGTLSFAVTRSRGAMRRVREQQDEKYYAPLVLIADGAAAGRHRGAAPRLPALPPSLQLVTLQLIDTRTLLVRLGHRYAVDEDAERSAPATVDMTLLLNGVTRHTVTGIEEVSLTAAKVIAPSVHSVTIGPMDVRTFIYYLTPIEREA